MKTKNTSKKEKLDKADIIKIKMFCSKHAINRLTVVIICEYVKILLNHYAVYLKPI